jgi:uncharacterized protein (DUF58 family)
VPDTARTSERKSEGRLEFLDPAVVSRLGGLELIARLVVEGFITGLHRSPYHGFSVEFAEHRPYMLGDEMKFIDWKVWAKTDRFYVKAFEEETNLRTYLLLDSSGSMGYGSGGVTKFRYAVMMAAAFAYLMLRQRDAVGLVLFDEELRLLLEPRAARRQLNVLLGALAQAAPAKRTKPLAPLRELAGRVKRRGLVIVLSDLLTDPAEAIRALLYFKHQEHEVVVFHILDPMELELDMKQEAIFRDMETGETVAAAPWEIRQDYVKSVRGMIETYRRELRAAHVDYQLVSTRTPFVEILTHYLVKRSRLG